jgi:redox-sensing transcriptional repressor
MKREKSTHVERNENLIDDAGANEPGDPGYAHAPSGLRINPNGAAIPDIVIRRLPIYARSLKYLAHEGVETVSSGELGARLGVSAAQIRRDLSYFGEFGKQGKGYNVDYLLGQISGILQLDREWAVALVGLGHLGQALLHYENLSQQGFCIEALFDHNPVKIGQKLSGLIIHAMEDLPSVLQARSIKMAIMAVPARGAQEAADALVAAGVQAILNYAPITVHVPPGVKIRHIDPVVALQSMTYYVEETRNQKSEIRNQRSEVRR